MDIFYSPLPTGGSYHKDLMLHLPSLRWEQFRSKNLEGEVLPPTRAALPPHIIRANYALCGTNDTSQTVLSIEENEWNLLESGCFIPVKCLALPAPKAVLKLIKCGCKAGCKGQCSCSINSLPCTPLCKCYSGDCANIVRDIQITDD